MFRDLVRKTNLKVFLYRFSFFWGIIIFFPFPIDLALSRLKLQFKIGAQRVSITNEKKNFCSTYIASNGPTPAKTMHFLFERKVKLAPNMATYVFWRHLQNKNLCWLNSFPNIALL